MIGDVRWPSDPWDEISCGQASARPLPGPGQVPSRPGLCQVSRPGLCQVPARPLPGPRPGSGQAGRRGVGALNARLALPDGTWPTAPPGPPPGPPPSPSPGQQRRPHGVARVPARTRSRRLPASGPWWRWPEADGCQPGHHPATRPDGARPQAGTAASQGTTPRHDPMEHGRRLARLIPGARLHLLPSEDHLTIEAPNEDQLKLTGIGASTGGDDAVLSACTLLVKPVPVHLLTPYGHLGVLPNRDVTLQCLCHWLRRTRPVIAESHANVASRP